MQRIRFASVRGVAVVAGALVASTAPGVHAQACTPFTDVAAADPFCASVQWMHNRGITLGCTANQYCPADPVRRDQMAAFMFRLGNAVHQQGGNAFGATAVLGTTDANAVDVRADNARVMRYEPNAISPNVIGGSPANGVTPGVRGATIAGGGVPSGNTDPDIISGAPNRVTDLYGTVGGGLANVAGDDTGSVTNAMAATVAGGWVNAASGTASAVGGGLANVASGQYSAVGGGYNNVASVPYSAVTGGASNLASGWYSTVAGGYSNVASGDGSLAAGSRADANHDGCFVWGDRSTFNTVSCNAPNRFVVRALGGVFFLAGGTTQETYTGVQLAPGGTGWIVVSDRAIKDNVAPVDPGAVLERLLAVPVATWNLRTQDPSIRHMGPMAQDFRSAFGLGESERGINTMDADGVALAAIQGLNAKLERAIRERDAALAAQAREVARLRSRLDELLVRVARRADAAR